MDGFSWGYRDGLALSSSARSNPQRLRHRTRIMVDVKSDTAIVTLATSISKIEDQYYTISPTSPENRIAVPLTSALSFPSTCRTGDLGLVYETGVCSPPYWWQIYKNYGYYSPGVCFSGYTIGCIATATIVNFEPVKPSETVAFCVPR